MYRCTSVASVIALSVVCATGCTKNPLSPDGSGGTAQLTAPAIDAPADDEQLTTLRPTLVVRNGTSNPSGTRTYEFQLATNGAFSPVALTGAGVVENSSGRTSFTPDQDLQSTTRYYWRARATQGTSHSDWSAIGRLRTKAVGYNNPGELFDPLVAGESVGQVEGPHAFVAGRGIKLNSATSYVRYALPATVSKGEFSMEIEGLAPGGPAGKPRLFSMLDGPGILTASRYEMNVQYRGRSGNPDNAIAFKAVWGHDSIRLEPELHERLQSVITLDPLRTYFWQATWEGQIFRLIVREDGVSGPEIYNRSKTAPGGTYAPSPHYAYLGANEVALGGEDGTFPGVTIRNVWLSEKPRPATLGNAIHDR